MDINEYYDLILVLLERELRKNTNSSKRKLELIYKLLLELQ